MIRSLLIVSLLGYGSLRSMDGLSLSPSTVFQLDGCLDQESFTDNEWLFALDPKPNDEKQPEKKPVKRTLPVSSGSIAQRRRVEQNDKVRLKTAPLYSLVCGDEELGLGLVHPENCFVSGCSRQGFDSKELLIEHLKNDHRVKKPLKCITCKVRLSTKQNFSAHYKLKHGDPRMYNMPKI